MDAIILVSPPLKKLLKMSTTFQDWCCLNVCFEQGSNTAMATFTSDALNCTNTVCWQLFWNLVTSSASILNTDKSKGKRHAREILNFLMPVCSIVCKCDFYFSPEFLFQQDKTSLYECKQILMAAVFGCFTMLLVLWPNAPIIGGRAMLFTP